MIQAFPFGVGSNTDHIQAFLFIRRKIYGAAQPVYQILFFDSTAIAEIRIIQQIKTSLVHLVDNEYGIVQFVVIAQNLTKNLHMTVFQRNHRIANVDEDMGFRNISFSYLREFNLSSIDFPFFSTEQPRSIDYLESFLQTGRTVYGQLVRGLIIVNLHIVFKPPQHAGDCACLAVRETAQQYNAYFPIFNCSFNAVYLVKINIEIGQILCPL